jgi:hypothetical protein
MVKIIEGPNGEPIRVKTGGRPKNGLNKRTLAFKQAQDEAKARLNSSLAGSTYKALDLLRAVYTEEGLDLDVRVHAASLAVKYESPALASVETRVDGSLGVYAVKTITVAERDPLPPEIQAKYDAAMKPAQSNPPPPALMKPAAPKPSTMRGFIERDPLPGAGITDVAELADER